MQNKRMSSFNPMRPKEMKQIDIQAISIISSCGCNLQCSYCVIAQSAKVSPYAHELQKNTIQALQDGTFLENVVNSLLALNQSPAKIRMLSLWGQEPTLTLHYLTEHWEDWYRAFPNLEKIYFSTNGMAFGERIFDFAKKIDQTATKQIELQVEVSYDGDFGTNNVRNANGDQIHNNVWNLVKQLNNYHFIKAHMMMCFHGVMSQALIDTLTDGEIIQDYFNKAFHWVEDIRESCTNKDVRIEPSVGFICESPIDASTEMGIDLAAFYKKLIKINPKYVDNFLGNMEAYSLLSAYQRTFRGIKNNPHATFTDLISDVLTDDQAFYDFLSFFSHSSFCGTFYGELKIMYDGTIIGCQNSMYEQWVDAIPPEESIKNGAKRTLATKRPYFVNPQTDDVNEIIKTFNIFKENRESSFLFVFGNTINLMMWMLEAHQIDESYRDPEKLLIHAFYMSLTSACIYNNYIQTGTFYGMATGTIRYFCNGFLDSILDNDGPWGGIVFD